MGEAKKTREKKKVKAFAQLGLRAVMREAD